LPLHAKSATIGPSADLCPNVSRSPPETPSDQWLFGIGFVIRRVLVSFATRMVQFLVAILVAVRCRLLLLFKTMPTANGALTEVAWNLKRVYAIVLKGLQLLQNGKIGTQNPPRATSWGFAPPPGTKILKLYMQSGLSRARGCFRWWLLNAAVYRSGCFTCYLACNEVQRVAFLGFTERSRSRIGVKAAHSARRYAVTEP
jgi:hypothetical protein